MKYISRCLQILLMLKCRPGGLDMIYILLILHLNFMYFFLAINLQLERLF